MVTSKADSDDLRLLNLELELKTMRLKNLQMEAKVEALQKLVCGSLETLSARVEARIGNQTKGWTWITDGQHNRRWYDIDSLPPGFRVGHVEKKYKPRLKVIGG